MKMKNFAKKLKRGQGHVIEVVILIVVVLLVALPIFGNIGNNIKNKAGDINSYLESGNSSDSSSGELPAELLNTVSIETAKLQ